MNTGRSHTVCLALLLISTTIAPSLAAEQISEEGTLTFCHFGPKLKVLEPKTTGTGEECTGTAKIQALLWQCETPEKVESTVESFKKKLRDEAAAECARHCERRAAGCTGIFDFKGIGLTTDREDAIVMGRRQGCRSDCAGKAFVFSSIYDAGFRIQDDSRISRQPPNCRCRRVEKQR